jgi:hypothetical protein
VIQVHVEISSYKSTLQKTLVKTSCCFGIKSIWNLTRIRVAGRSALMAFNQQ